MQAEAVRGQVAMACQQGVDACIVCAATQLLGCQVNLSTRPDKFVGSERIWDQAEQALKAALLRKVRHVAPILCTAPWHVALAVMSVSEGVWRRCLPSPTLPDRSSHLTY